MVYMKMVYSHSFIVIQTILSFTTCESVMSLNQPANESHQSLILGRNGSLLKEERKTTQNHPTSIAASESAGNIFTHFAWL